MYTVDELNNGWWAVMRLGSVTDARYCVGTSYVESDARAIADALNEREAMRAEVERLREALGLCAYVIGHNNCTDGKTPNGFAVALNHARAALATPQEATQ